MSKRTLILGKGFIGQRLAKELKCAITGRMIFKYNDVAALIKRFKPKTIINAIGYTGANNVDDCEKDVQGTISANTFVPLLLAEAAYRHNIKLVHISSGCIYNFNYGKQKPISETLIPDYYKLYYSRTKIYTENVLSQLVKRCNILTLRIRIPLDNRPHSKNILNKLIKYKTIIDTPNSITYIPEFIQTLKYLLKMDARGTFNTVLKGGLKYRHLLNVYQKYKPNYEYSIIKMKDLNLDRTNLLLSTKKLENTGFPVSRPKDIFEKCVKEYVKY